MIEKVALIDVCDVAVDLCNTTILQAGLKIDFSKVKTWDMFAVISKEECARVIDLFNTPEYWRYLPPVPGVHEGIEGLRRQGYKIQWVTSPWHSCKNWEGIRRIWLQEQGLVKDMVRDVTITSEKYMIDGDIFLDDRPKHVKLWAAKHPERRSYMFDMKFNHHVEWNHRARWCKEGIEEI